MEATHIVCIQATEKFPVTLRAYNAFFFEKFLFAKDYLFLSFSFSPYLSLFRLFMSLCKNPQRSFVKNSFEGKFEKTLIDKPKILFN